MTTTFVQFMQTMQQETLVFRKALTVESDRGCALFAAAYLDKALSDLLYLSLVENKKIESELFEGTAPLATFSSRIKLAYYLGKISAGSRSDLDTIRNIRNAFAHKIDLISFDTQSIADRCRNLGFSYHDSNAKPREHFTAAVTGLLGMLLGAGLKSEAPKEKSNDWPSETAREEHRALVAAIEKELGTKS